MALRLKDHICLDMKKYSQLTSAQRYEIGALLSNGFTQCHIADQIGVHPCTISRELKRNCDQRNKRYDAGLAQRKCEDRHHSKAKPIIFTEALQRLAIHFLKEEYSPEQIVGVCKRNNEEMVSHERLYPFIWADKKKGGDLYKHLRTKGKRYRKRGALKDARGLIPNRIDIDHRPDVVDSKTRIGDLEVDTIIGKDHQGAIVTINDRLTGMLKMKYVSSREAHLVEAAILSELEDWTPFIKTITADNGKEFSNHQNIAEKLDIDFFFAKPYHSWQRGANENLNGLIRQYLPKKSDFSNLDQHQINQIQKKLNDRPRKRHNFKSPNEVFADYIKQTNIALMN